MPLGTRDQAVSVAHHVETEITWRGSPGGSDGKESVCNGGDPSSIPGSGRSPGEGRKWQPTLVLLPGKAQGRRNLAGYSPWSLKESDTTERLHFHFSSGRAGMRSGLFNTNAPTPSTASQI